MRPRRQLAQLRALLGLRQHESCKHGTETNKHSEQEPDQSRDGRMKSNRLRRAAAMSARICLPLDALFCHKLDGPLGPTEQHATQRLLHDHNSSAAQADERDQCERWGSPITLRLAAASSFPSLRTYLHVGGDRVSDIESRRGHRPGQSVGERRRGRVAGGRSRRKKAQRSVRTERSGAEQLRCDSTGR